MSYCRPVASEASQPARFRAACFRDVALSLDFYINKQLILQFELSDNVTSRQHAARQDNAQGDKTTMPQRAVWRFVMLLIFLFLLLLLLFYYRPFH
jgi:hypothetical protein